MATLQTSWESRLDFTPSRGHWAWAYAPGAGLIEYYAYGGHLHRAPASNVIDLDTAVRIGRWEGPDRPGIRENIRNVWRSPESHWEEVTA